MVLPYVAWPLVAVLLALLVSQNAELNLAPFACSSRSVQQFYDVAAFIFGSAGSGELLAACSLNVTRRIHEECGASSGDVVLELGFGTGRLAKLLFEEAAVLRYDGVELSEGMLNVTAQRVSDVASARRLQLHQSDRPLEILQSSETLHTYSHVYVLFVLDALSPAEIKQALELLHSRTRPGGRLCLATLTDVPDDFSVKLYRAAWRIAPLLLGGRRPLSLQELIDSRRWSKVGGWVETNWLPFEVFILEKQEFDDDLEQAFREATAVTRQQRRETAMLRWAPHMSTALGKSYTPDILRQLAADSAEWLPLDAAKYIATLWMQQLEQATMKNIIGSDINDMEIDDMVSHYARRLQATPGALLLQEVRLHVRRMKTKDLSDWLSPPAANMTIEELREHVDHTLDDTLKAARNDVDLAEVVLRHTEAAAKMVTREELLKLNEEIEKKILVPPSEMSRDELERAVFENVDIMPRPMLEEVLIREYESKTDAQLRENLRDSLKDMSREELEERAREAVDALLDETSLRAAAREVALNLLTDGELKLLAVDAVQHKKTREKTSRYDDGDGDYDDDEESVQDYDLEDADGTDAAEDADVSDGDGILRPKRKRRNILSTWRKAARKGLRVTHRKPAPHGDSEDTSYLDLGDDENSEEEGDDEAEEDEDKISADEELDLELGLLGI